MIQVKHIPMIQQAVLCHELDVLFQQPVVVLVTAVLAGLVGSPDGVTATAAEGRR